MHRLDNYLDNWGCKSPLVTGSDIHHMELLLKKKHGVKIKDIKPHCSPSFIQAQQHETELLFLSADTELPHRRVLILITNHEGSSGEQRTCHHGARLTASTLMSERARRARWRALNTSECSSQTI